MDQFVEIIRYPSPEGVHHEIHSFLHHLHLRDHVWWSRICSGWIDCILLPLFAWGVATLWPFLVPSLSAGVSLAFRLSVKACVLLVQLLF